MMNVLALNSGSSSLKFGLYRVGAAQADLLFSGETDAIGDGQGGRIKSLLAEAHMPAPTAIGHRIVHGGPALRHHVLIDDAVLRQLEAAAAFAPLHMPVALSLIRFAREQFPDTPQVACFDTRFHAQLPEAARALAIPKELRLQGIQRYGFHGLSCESIVHRLAHDLPDRIVIAHLGNGASVTAVKGGRSIDTSMGLTPTGGVIMGTRSGDLDPGVLVYLMREKQFDADKVEDLVNHHCGLLGVSGLSSDMRRLHEAASTNADARLAIEMFCNSVRKQVAAMTSVLGGLDLLVFTGGIGENDALVRAAICDGLTCMGVSLDEARNLSANNPVNDSASHCKVLVLASNENQQIARNTWAALASPCSASGQ